MPGALAPPATPCATPKTSCLRSRKPSPPAPSLSSTWSQTPTSSTRQPASPSSPRIVSPAVGTPFLLARRRAVRSPVVFVRRDRGFHGAGVGGHLADHRLYEPALLAPPSLTIHPP